MDDALAPLETEIRSLEEQAAWAERLAAAASSEDEANTQARLASTFRASAASLRRVVERVRALR